MTTKEPGFGIRFGWSEAATGLQKTRSWSEFDCKPNLWARRASNIVAGAMLNRNKHNIVAGGLEANRH